MNKIIPNNKNCKMHFKTLIICSSFFIFTPVFSQKVSINKIDEKRSTSDDNDDNKCDIELKISGDEVRKFKFVEVSKIFKVIDDQGLDLLKNVEHDFGYNDYREIEKDAKITIETKIPARKATLIKELSGEINLYNPTEENGAIIKISNYQNKTNINLLPKTSKAQVLYLTKESFEKYSLDQKLKKEEELKKMPIYAKEMMTALMNAFSGFTSFSNDKDQAVFFIGGDESEFVDVYFEDSNGKRMEDRMTHLEGDLIIYDFENKIDPTWKLVLNIETIGSIKKIPFKLLDIELP